MQSSTIDVCDVRYEQINSIMAIVQGSKVNVAVQRTKERRKPHLEYCTKVSQGTLCRRTLVFS